MWKYCKLPVHCLASYSHRGGTLQHHLESLKERYPKEVEEIKRSVYIDDLITGGVTKDKVRDLKQTAIAVFREAQFDLHKWHSNKPELETSAEPNTEGEKKSYAKEQLRVEPGESKMLGLPWNRRHHRSNVSTSTL